MSFSLKGGISINTGFERQWTYRLSVTLPDGKTRVFSYPLTCEFNITRNTFAQANTGNFTLYNLNPTHRDEVYKDLFLNNVLMGITFEVGYEGQLTKIFSGNIQTAYSQRVGTETQTIIQAWDTGITTSFTSDIISITFETDVTFKEAYKNVCSIANIQIGAIGTLEGKFKQPTTFVGKPLAILNQITEGHTFSDNGVINTLQNNECLDYGVSVLNADTGLLGTPLMHGAQVEVESTLKPDIVVGQLLEIKSTTASRFSGTYVVIGLNHSGTISGSEASTRKTTLNLMNGRSLPNSTYNVTADTSTPEFKKVKQENVTPVSNQYGASVAEVYRFIKDNNGAIPDKKINPRISWREMLGNNNTNADRFSEITTNILNNCVVTADRLFNTIQASYPNQPIAIISGWRSKANNTIADGEVNSRHLQGQAIDFNFMTQNTKLAFMNVIKKQWSNYTYLNKYGNIHVQTTGSNPYV